MVANNNLKTNITNSVYQSQILPVIQKAETEIKKLVSYYGLYLKSRAELLSRISGIIKAVENRLPISLYDKQQYIDGLQRTAMKMVKEFYDKVVARFNIIVGALLILSFKKKVKTPIELQKLIEKDTYTKKFIEENKRKIDVWAMQKGYPNVINYPQELKERLNGLAKTEVVAAEPGKKPITVWQKAELDIRYENQLNMIDKLKQNGVKLAWISTHPDCSKRCQAFQGCLVSLDLHAKNPQKSVKNYRYNKSSFIVGKVDGESVYSLLDIQDVETGYGYKNNIITGFNCRHKLRPYTPGSIAPQEYSAEEVKEQREINQKLRAMERKIRYLKQRAILYNSIDKQKAAYYKEQAKILTEQYKKFANKNGYAWYQWRIEV